MKTTVELDEQVFRRAKMKAAATGRPLRDLIQAALIRELDFLDGEEDLWLEEASKIAANSSIRDAVKSIADGRKY